MVLAAVSSLLALWLLQMAAIITTVMNRKIDLKIAHNFSIYGVVNMIPTNLHLGISASLKIKIKVLK